MARFDQAAAVAMGINLTDLHCIDLLKDGALSPYQIADRLGLTRPAVTAVLDRLTESGFLIRRPSLTDRRRSEIRLTALGRRRAAKVFGQLGREIENDLGQQSAEERARFVAAIDDLSQACDRASNAIKS